MAQVSVTINGRVYRMACDDGQEQHLIALGQQLSKTIDELRESIGEVGDQRLTVMAAITLADDLSEAKNRLARLEEEVGRLSAAEAHAAARAEASEGQLVAALEAASGRLEQAAMRLSGDSAAA